MKKKNNEKIKAEEKVSDYENQNYEPSRIHRCRCDVTENFTFFICNTDILYVFEEKRIYSNRLLCQLCIYASSDFRHQPFLMLNASDECGSYLPQVEHLFKNPYLIRDFSCID